MKERVRKRVRWGSSSTTSSDVREIDVGRSRVRSRRDVGLIRGEEWKARDRGKLSWSRDRGSSEGERRGSKVGGREDPTWGRFARRVLICRLFPWYFLASLPSLLPSHRAPQAFPFLPYHTVGDDVLVAFERDFWNFLAATALFLSKDATDWSTVRSG